MKAMTRRQARFHLKKRDRDTVEGALVREVAKPTFLVGRISEIRFPWLGAHLAVG